MKKKLSFFVAILVLAGCSPSDAGNRISKNSNVGIDKEEYASSEYSDSTIEIIADDEDVQSQNNSVVRSDGGKKELIEAVEDEDIQEQLDSPDGVAIEMLPNGEWKIYAQGSESYDFNEADEIRVATRNARMRAEAAISKFLKQKIQSKETLEDLSEKVKNISSENGGSPSLNVAKTTVKTSVEQIVASSEAILSGLITISTEKKPLGDGGSMIVVVGVSSKTMKAVQTLRSGKTNANSVSNKKKSVDIASNDVTEKVQSNDSNAKSKQSSTTQQDGGKQELKEAVEDEDIQEQLDSPDGVAIEMLPDGEWKIYAQGSDTYDFNESDEIRVATRNARMRAESAISKFLEQKIQSKETLEDLSEKVKNISSENGGSPSLNVAKTTVKTSVEQIIASSEAILSGLITISTEKKPIGDGGTITVVVGVSSKTMKAVQTLRNSQKNLNSPNAKRGTYTGTFSKTNKREKTKTKSDF